MKRPVLNEIPLDPVMQDLLNAKPYVVITMSVGQWDGLLAAAYENQVTLLELDEAEHPVKAYRRLAS